MIKIRFLEVELTSPSQIKDVVASLLATKNNLKEENNPTKRSTDNKSSIVVNTGVVQRTKKGDVVSPVTELLQNPGYPPAQKTKADVSPKTETEPKSKPRGVSVTDKGEIFAYFRKYAYNNKITKVTKGKQTVNYHKTMQHWLDNITKNPENPDLYLTLDKEDAKDLPAKPIGFAVIELTPETNSYFEDWALEYSSKDPSIFNKNGDLVYSKICRKHLEKYIRFTPEIEQLLRIAKARTSVKEKPE